jgi:hypothetical protein
MLVGASFEPGFTFNPMKACDSGGRWSRLPSEVELHQMLQVPDC